ncbi:carbon-nitrogen hydrolase [Leptodontidium sp. MPI-SDFR-AT-0119]|nr:carbon-nitrogen hydrolase [Leptodontidium sp. MPI-SDFR-AT-0119]
MRIACLQFAPQVGDIENNLNRADAVLSRANPQNLDLLVLPELAFTGKRAPRTAAFLFRRLDSNIAVNQAADLPWMYDSLMALGYNFQSLAQISPFLEPTTAGITSLWARTTALKYNCVVIAGYPEKVDLSPKWPASPEYYNSAITVNAEGETIANYRKSFLYSTDETWALEGPDGFYDGEIDGLGTVAMGICMDLNPYKFEAPWNTWEFAQHVLLREVNLVVLSMAWMTREDTRSFSREPKEPDMETLSYWLARLEPLIRNEGEDEIIAVFANRTGSEGNATYAGTSAVLGIQAGEVKVYGILGRGERELLVVDTAASPTMQLVSEPRAKTPALKVDVRASTLSSDCSADSDQSLNSALSISTGHTSIVSPSLDPCSFSPISPADNHSPQAYFAASKPVPICPIPDQKRVKERKPTPIPAQSESKPPIDRYPTPVPVPSVYSRPSSPKSRNCSRSRGPDLNDSPPLLGSMMGNILSDEEREERIKNSPLLESMNMIGKGIDTDLIADDPDEIMYIEDEDSPRFGTMVGNVINNGVPLTRADFIAKHINNDLRYSPLESLARSDSPRILPKQPVATDLPIRTRMDTSTDISEQQPGTASPTDGSLSPVLVESSPSQIHRSSPVESANYPIQSKQVQAQPLKAIPTADSLQGAPVVVTHTDHKPLSTFDIFASAVASQWESSFTRNPLGPRSRHIVPRPLSTVW